MPSSFIKQALPNGKMSPELAAEGVRVQRLLDTEYTYTYFQWNDPIWGGSELHKVALRRAVAMAINREEEIEIIRKGNAVRAEFLVPPGVAGHKAEFTSSITYNPPLANALLDKFGYKKGPTAFGTPRTASLLRSSTRQRRLPLSASSMSSTPRI
jgi:oligopeptide transport system substrate-binding protein